MLTTVPRSRWMDPYVSFLSNGSLPNDPKELEKIRRTSSRFWLFEGNKLYRCLFKGPYLLCLHLDKVTELLTELHDTICGGHSKERSLAHRAMTQRFGGRACRETRLTMSKNMTSVRNMARSFTSLVEI